ncbi:hypothetical protein GMORB2_2568 [Geosmithia morbida]|uniref:Uncharacterized protein n=1 Tax=Geosmithia morbida TaxID=1094350 RepID=A0A9P5D002_9HYPO|nr:uncharacterized protein GMORB2_2568 [Geosmithia morbida]KAF4121082.1 hypothetical protein GMORB2_2568 [Geosmithia morbida]
MTLPTTSTHITHTPALPLSTSPALGPCPGTIIEIYSACRCVYYAHAIDQCASYGRPSHDVMTKNVYVGYACDIHVAAYSQPGYSASGPASADSAYAYAYAYSDSGYHSSNGGAGAADSPGKAYRTQFFDENIFRY